MAFTPLLHFDSIVRFRLEFFKDLLDLQHLKGGQIQIQKLTFPDGGVNETANFWGWVLEKDGVKYLLPAHSKDGGEIKIRDTLPILAQDLEKVAHQGVAYWLIHKPVSVRFKPIRTMDFKRFIDIMSSMRHSNPDHQKLLWFMAMTQLFDRANFRVSTPAGMGKDSVVDICGNLFGGAATIESPTLAKLEERSINLKWLTVNEVVDIPTAEWKVIEQFLLAAGAHKPMITKHSRAFGNVGEELDISKFSLSLFYNDIDHYPEMDKYFDLMTKDAVRDRFPAFRLNGNFIENFNEIRTIDVKEFVKDNMNIYKDLIYAFTYYKENFMNELHHWKVNEKFEYAERWKTNIGKLVRIIDMYCDSQEEFDKWIRIMTSAIADYSEMLHYPQLREALDNKYSKSEVIELTKTFKKLNTYVERNNYIRKLLQTNNQNTVIHDDKFWA